MQHKVYASLISMVFNWKFTWCSKSGVHKSEVPGHCGD